MPSSRSQYTNWKFWNLNEVRDDATIAAFGPRRSGKSLAIRSILRAKNLPRGVVCCPTPDAFISYGKFIPSCFIYDEFDESILEKIMSFQKIQALKCDALYDAELAALKDRHDQIRADKWKQREERLSERAERNKWTPKQIEVAWLREIEDEKFENQQGESAIRKFMDDRKDQLRRPFSMFVVLDDLSSNKQTMNSPVLRYIINNGRHYLLLLMVAVQYAVDFPCGCRGGLDWIVVFFDSIRDNVDKIFNKYVGIFPNRASFDEALSDAARRRCALVIKKNNPSPRLSDSVFLFSPDLPFGEQTFFGDKTFAYVNAMFFDEAKAMEQMRKTKNASTKSDNGQKSKRGGRKSVGDELVADKPKHRDRKEAAEAEPSDDAEIEQQSDEEPEDFERRRKETIRKRQFDADLRALRSKMKSKAAKKQTVARERDRAAVKIGEPKPAAAPSSSASSSKRKESPAVV